jgi:HAD superfamily hydrolase (TIGR01490 family)
MPGTAIFDLDRTITRSPTWTPFLFYVHGLNPVFLFRFLLLALYMIGYKLKLVSRDSVKKYGIQTLATIDKETLKNKAEAFVASRIAHGLRPGAVEAIIFHQQRGDRLILATAAVDMVANPLGLALGFDEVIATRLSWNIYSNALAPCLDGANCYGLEKLRRVEERRSLQPFDEPVYAYSDHVSDLELLRQADHGIAVNPSTALRNAAHKCGIKIVDFDAASSSTKTLE